MVAVDVNQDKVDFLIGGLSPIIEPGLSESILSVVRARRLKATTDPAGAVSSTDVSFICVPGAGLGTALRAATGYSLNQIGTGYFEGLRDPLHWVSSGACDRDSKVGLGFFIDLPVIHNRRPVVRLVYNYVDAYRFMLRKWKTLLPWPTVIVQLTRNPFPRRARLRYKAYFKSSTLLPMLENPEQKAKELGFAKTN